MLKPSFFRRLLAFFHSLPVLKAFGVRGTALVLLLLALLFIAGTEARKTRLWPRPFPPAPPAPAAPALSEKERAGAPLLEIGLPAKIETWPLPESLYSASRKISGPGFEGNGRSGKAGAKSPAEEFLRLSQAVFDSLPALKAYEAMKARFAEARALGALDGLFQGFAQSRAFRRPDYGKKTARELLRRWASDARAETNEDMRGAYARHLNAIRHAAQGSAYLNQRQIRPGQGFSVQAYAYSGEGRSLFRAMKLEVARLRRDSAGFPLAFEPLDTLENEGRDQEIRFTAEGGDAGTETGIYRLTALGEEFFWQDYLQVGRLDLTVKCDDKHLALFGSSFGNELKGPFLVHLLTPEGAYFRTKTDAAGLKLLALPKGVALPRTFSVFLELETGTAKKGPSEGGGTGKAGGEGTRELAFSQVTVYGRSSRGPALLGHLFTDRPIYRPGQTAHFRGLLKRLVDEARLQGSGADSVTVVVRNPKWEEFYRRTLALDRFGHFGDSLPLLETAPLGRYSVQLERARWKRKDGEKGPRKGNGGGAGAGGGAGVETSAARPPEDILPPDFMDPGEGQVHAEASFEVEAYKKPEFRIALSPERETQLLSDTARVRVKGEYYFGGPLAGARIRLRWYRQSLHHYFDHYPGRAPRMSFFPGGDEVLVGEDSLTLDEKGEGLARFKGRLTEPYNFLVLEAGAVDLSRREVRERAAVKVVKHDLYLGVTTDKWSYEAGDSARFRVTAGDLEGKPVEGKVSLRLKRGNEIVDETEVALGKEGSKEDGPRAGEGTAAFLLEEAGSYTIEASMRTKKGKRVFVESHFHVQPKNQGGSEERFSLTLDKPFYRPGDTALVALEKGASLSQVLFTLEGHALRAARVRDEDSKRAEGARAKGSPEDGRLRYRLPLPRSLGLNVAVGASLSGRNQALQIVIPVPIVDSSFLARVVLEPKAGRVKKPGERFEGRIRVTDAAGKPVQGAFSAAVLDEALYALAKPAPRYGIYGGFRGGMEMGFPGGEGAGREPSLLDLLPSYFENRVFTASSYLSASFLNDIALAALAGEGDRLGFGRAFEDRLAALGKGPALVDWKVLGGTISAYRGRGGDRVVTPSGEVLGAIVGGAARGPEAVVQADGAMAMAQSASPAPARAAKRYGRGRADEAAQTEGLVMALAEPGAANAAPPPPPRERQDFRDLAYYRASIETDARGEADLSFPLPDDLTRWRILLRGSAGAAGAAGPRAPGAARENAEGKTDLLLDYRDSVTVKKDLMVKLESPRFFVAGDSAVLSAVLHNYTGEKLNLKTRLELRPPDAAERAKAGASSGPVGRSLSPLLETLEVGSGGSGRADWRLVFDRPGLLRPYVEAVPAAAAGKGVKPVEGDAESRSYPVLLRGVIETESFSGMLTGPGTGGPSSGGASFALALPANTDPLSRRLEIRLSSSLSRSLFESLEYLTGYPYGCVEQTLSRFVPNLIVADALKRLKIKNDSLLQKIPEYTKKGLDRLEQLQQADGSFGWWEGGEADLRMTALVISGLSELQAVELGPEDRKRADILRDRAVTALEKRLSAARMRAQPLELAEAVKALSRAGRSRGREAKKGLDELYALRGRLGPYGLALLAEALHLSGEGNRRDGVVRLLLTHAVLTDGSRATPGKAGEARGAGAAAGKGAAPQGGPVHFTGEESSPWYGEDAEATAQALRALLLIDPQSPFIPRIVAYLALQKRQGYWTSTKTTAAVLSALTRYLVRTGELEADYTALVKVNGREWKRFKARGAETPPLAFSLEADSVPPTSRIDIEVSGKGNLYYTSSLRYAAKEFPIRAKGRGLRVEREYRRLDYRRNKKGEWEVRRVPFEGTLKAGEEVEVSVRLKAEAPGEYLLLEDYFPAGAEVLDKPQEFYDRWCGFWFFGYTHKERRDDRMVFFLDRYPKGEQVFRYLLRAETPGHFTALPARAELMYHPEVSAHSAEIRARIRE